MVRTRTLPLRSADAGVRTEVVSGWPGHDLRARWGRREKIGKKRPRADFLCYAHCRPVGRFGQGIEFVFLPKAPDQWMSGCRIALQPRSPRPTSYRPLCKRCCLRPHASASAEIFGETVADALSFCSGTRWIGFISYYYFYIFNYVIQSL